MIDSYTKWAEAVPLKEKSAANVWEAFEYGVISRFGAPFEVVTDRGREFMGEFAAGLERYKIQGRQTSADSPQGNGLSERLVQTIKGALTKG